MHPCRVGTHSVRFLSQPHQYSLSAISVTVLLHSIFRRGVYSRGRLIEGAFIFKILKRGGRLFEGAFKKKRRLIEVIRYTRTG